MKKKDIFLIILRCVIALSLFAVAIIYYDELSTIDVRALADVTDKLVILIIMVLSLYIVKALVFVVPASLVYVAVGAIMDPVIAVIVNLTGIFIEVSVTYWLGRFLGKDAVHKLLSKKETGRKLLEKDIQSKASVLLTIRAIPAFPIDFVSLFYGASGCAYLKYALLSLAGISWRVILFTILGDAIFSWIPMDKIILIVICLIPVGVIYYLVKKFVLEPKKANKEQTGEK
ncbi:MAG: VTT domain-containing protein [Ruminococcaceae bacterium]|nr:VTT domain-containing protein [Oscillospiraceae bacterium]